MSTPVLIRFVHGLGDVVQFSVILKHLRKYRADWQVTVRCGRGKHSALNGLCHRVMHDQEPEPNDHDYKIVLELMWFENYNRFPDRPNSKITNCLREVFGLEWDRELGCYHINVRDEAKIRAREYLTSIGALGKAVILHYQGNTSERKKNLLHWQAEEICRTILAAGRVPVLFDWDNRSNIADNKTIFKPHTGKGDIWGGFGSGDAETIAALIELSAAYVGIDSGPGKVASATATPTLINWIGHHPIQFHDLAENTLHLVPANHRTMTPACDDTRIADFFEKNYRFRTYNGEHDLVTQIRLWLSETLKCPEIGRSEMETRFVIPNGIGDTIWALTKIRSIAGDKPVNIVLSGDPSRALDHRTVPFLERFDFVRRVQVLDIPVLHDKHERPARKDGRYDYVPDGLRGDFHYLVPNAVLEQGERLETWQPDHPVDWDIMSHFSWANTERGDSVGQAMETFAAFYLGPEGGHTDEGHNFGWLWEPKHWIALGRMFKERGLNIALFGADYDRSFWERYVKEGVEADGQKWIDLIGRFEIGETFACLKHARVLISYQCGLGIVSHYLGVPVVMWWRPDGNTLHPVRHICFDNRMKDAWVRPGREDRYMGCLYGRETPGDIMAEIDRKGWLK